MCILCFGREKVNEAECCAGFAEVPVRVFCESMAMVGCTCSQYTVSLVGGGGAAAGWKWNRDTLLYSNSGSPPSVLIIQLRCQKDLILEKKIFVLKYGLLSSYPNNA